MIRIVFCYSKMLRIIVYTAFALINVGIASVLRCNTGELLKKYNIKFILCFEKHGDTICTMIKSTAGAPKRCVVIFF